MITEEAAAALRKATKWAQSGLIVSVGPPVETANPESTSGLSTGDKKKTAQTSICRERNSELARWDFPVGLLAPLAAGPLGVRSPTDPLPHGGQFSSIKGSDEDSASQPSPTASPSLPRTDPVRPFISGHVANSMAAEVIALLHSLLMAPESNAAQIWTTTAEKVSQGRTSLSLSVPVGITLVRSCRVGVVWQQRDWLMNVWLDRGGQGRNEFDHSLLGPNFIFLKKMSALPCPQVLSRALMYIPQLGKYAESILENGSSSGRKLAKLQRIARQAVAALCALGGFKETIKIGSEVQVAGRDRHHSFRPGS